MRALDFFLLISLGIYMQGCRWEFQSTAAASMIIEPVGRYQILGVHILSETQILGGHNHYFTINCSKY